MIVRDVKFVAIVNYSAQVGPDSWQTFQDVMPLDGTEGAQEIMTWADRITNCPGTQVTLSVIKP